MQTLRSRATRAGGFTMVELAVVVTIIGVLVVAALPRYQFAIERARATQAFSTLAQLQASQERYSIENGMYARTLRALDLEGSLPLGFRLSSHDSGNWETGYRIVLRREGATNGFGRYTIVWSQDGFLIGPSTIPDSLLPRGYHRKILLETQGETLSSR
ncbi:MAG: hypothetical protein CMJ94_03030 [Planctomycetes bacterium]|nr:hypothetical protein [Planctomycetota bacterium]